MKTILMYVTADGKQHKTQQDATRHLDIEYGNKLTRIAHNLVAIGKYQETAEWIDDNLHLFAELKAIADDMALIEEEE